MNWFHDELKLVGCVEFNVDGFNYFDVMYQDCHGVKVDVKRLKTWCAESIPSSIEKFEVLDIDGEIYFVVGRFNVRCDGVCINCRGV